MRSSPIFRFPFGKRGGKLDPFLDSRHSESQSKGERYQQRGEHKSSGMETTKGTMYGHEQYESERERESARGRERARERDDMLTRLTVHATRTTFLRTEPSQAGHLERTPGRHDCGGA